MSTGTALHGGTRPTFAARMLFVAAMITLVFSFGAVGAYGQNFYHDTSAVLPNLYNSAVALGDYNNDGYLDIAVLGSRQPQYAVGNGVVTRIYRSNGNGTFTDIAAGIDSVYGGSVAWGDYDNDGKLDLLIMGGNSDNVAVTELYHNDGNGVFTKNTATAFQGSIFGTVAWGDFNNDGHLDFVMNGYNNADTSHPFSKLYKNNGDGTFSEVANSGILGLNGHSKVAWGDYDNDGYPDLLVCGRSYPAVGPAVPVTILYHNNHGDGTFTEDTSAHLVGVWLGSVAWADFNNDGLLDLVVSGATSYPGTTSDTTVVYKNNGDGTFSAMYSAPMGTNWTSLTVGDFNNDGRPDFYVTGWGGGEGLYINETSTFSQHNLSGTGTFIASGGASWGDMNNDGRLDLVLSGQDIYAGTQHDTTTVLMGTNGGSETDWTHANTAPTAPPSLRSAVTGNSVALAWGEGNDNQSPIGELTYNLRVGTTAGGSDVVSPLSDATGFHRVARFGTLDTNWTLKGLSTGVYHWSVQSIDQAFAGSPFATEGTFEVGPVAVLSPSTIAFDTVALHASKTDSIKVKNTGTTSLTIVAKTVTDTSFAFAKDTLTIPAGDSAYFALTFAPKTVGVHSENMVFTSNTIKGSDTVSVSGFAYNPIVISLSVTPKTLPFDSIAVNATEKLTLRIKNTGNDTLRFWATTFGDTVFSVAHDTSAVLAGDSTTREVTFAPIAAGNFSGIVVLNSNAVTAKDTVTMTGRAYIPLEVRVSVTPKTLAFDSLVIHARKIDTVKVTNIGNDTLRISAFVSGAAQFTTRTDTVRVAPLDSAFFPVTFAPVAVASSSGNLIFTSNAVSVHDTVALSGKGYIMTVLQARQAPVGSTVAFNAYVTRAMGKYIYVQDTAAGMVLYNPQGTLLDTLKAGALSTLGTGIQVVGKTSAYNNLLEIAGSTIVYWQLMPNSPTTIQPIALTLAQIKASGEAYEARLISVANFTVVGTTDSLWKAAFTYSIVDNSDTTKAVSLRIGNAGDTQIDSLVRPNKSLVFVGPLSQFSSSNPTAGYQLMPILVGDLSVYTSVEAPPTEGIPTEFALKQNYPNPFNPSTTIAYSVPKDAHVTIEVYNIIGQLVATLVNDTQPAGNYTVRFNANGYASGLYLVRMVTPQQTFVRKMMLVK